MATRIHPGGRRVASLLGLALALGCGFEPRPESPAAGLEFPPAFLEQVVFEGYTGALRDVVVRADRARIDPQSRMAELEQVAVEITGGPGPPLEIRSARGQFDLDRDDFVLLEGVTGTLTDGSRFETPVLRYLQASGQLTSESSVSLKRPHMTLSAAGMRMNLSEQRVWLSGRVVARLSKG